MDKDFLIFSTEAGSPYLYDANTNSAHPLPFEVGEDYVRAVYDTPAPQPVPLSGDTALFPLERYFDIWREKTDAFQRKPVQRRVELQSIESARRSQVSSGLACDLILIVTEQCNMRCAYCVYEEDLYDNRRTHVSRFMDRETARRAIDLYLDINTQDPFKPFAKRALNIVFYEGEPLLNWPVISDAVAYAREKYRGDAPLYIGMTSNLTLLDKAWLPFLRRHDVFINVSLDGPRGEHDRYRHFADGSPSFAAVYRGLAAIREFDETYFAKNIKAALTCNGNTRYMDVVDFFDNDPNSPFIYTVSALKDLETGRFHARYPFDHARFNDEKLAVRAKYEEALLQNGPPPRGSALYALAYDAQSTHFHLPHSSSGRREWFTGACLPGRKIVVAPDGEIHPCECIGMDYPVGNVDTGLDEERVLEYFNSFFASTDECGACWARARCGICPAEVDSTGALNFENRCDGARRAARDALVSEYTQLEKTPAMFTKEYPYY